MQRSINFFSALLINIFDLISNSSCTTFIGEPDYPEELLK
ncbi:AgrD family cyclic lactone autoinducer peptide [Clostridium uliginosum]